MSANKTDRNPHERAWDKASFCPAAFDHHSPLYAKHWPDIYKVMRSECPVQRTEAHNGFWVVTRYEDVMTIAQDDETFSSAQSIVIPPIRIKWDRAPAIPIDLDPPESRMFRKILDPLVAPARARALAPFVRELAVSLIDEFIETGTVDFTEQFGSPLTSIATMRIAGLPQSDWRVYAEPIQRQIAGATPIEDTAAAYERAKAALAREVEKQRTAPITGGMIEYLHTAKLNDGRPLLHWEIENIVWLILLGGVDTTQALMGHSFVHLARHPQLRRQLANKEVSMDDFLQEALRVFSPQQALARTVTRDVDFKGHRFKRGDKVLLCWASANHDPTQFPNPESVDLDRDNKRHMAFGVGMHRCMGSHIAQMEAAIAIEEVLRLMPDYEVIEEGLELSPSCGVVNAFKHLPIRFTPRARREA